VTRHDALRWVRALTLATVMLATGASGHVATGGVAPPVALLGPILVVLTLAVSPFLDAPASSLRVVALVLAAQEGLHVLLELTGSTPATAPAPMAMPGSPGHPMSQAMSDPSTHLGMLAAHVAAALVVALWLAAGERAVWTLLAVVAMAVAEAWQAIRSVGSAVPTVVAPARRRSGVTRARPVVVRRSVWEGRGRLARRGPPCACAAA